CWALQGPTKVSGFVGGSVEVPCEYKPKLVGANKYSCRGSLWLSCSILVQTTAPEDKAFRDRVSLQDNPARHIFVVTMQNLTVEDGDQYWCGIQVPGYDPMFLVNVSVLPVRNPPLGPHLVLSSHLSSPALQQPAVTNLSRSPGPVPSAALVLLLGVITCCRMRRASLEKSRAAQAVEKTRDRDLQLTSNWEQAAASSNIYTSRDDLSSPEHDYENSPGKQQDFEKGDNGSVSGAPEMQPIYMNTG
ncbi:PREDICTED: CMRF35-like molecule 4, partial [Chlamydotis macqueenii]|uniref:CMRF35-like molecule 4 n=1 Tax=Chlamydotis macqueenii TaxID=187382 RepID=UPI000529AE14